MAALAGGRRVVLHGRGEGEGLGQVGIISITNLRSVDVTESRRFFRLIIIIIMPCGRACSKSRSSSLKPLSTFLALWPLILSEISTSYFASISLRRLSI